MSSLREKFGFLRQKLTQVRDDGDYLRADLDVDPTDTELLSLLKDLRDVGAIQEIRSGGKLLAHDAAVFGIVSLAIDTPRIEGYYETWEMLIQRHPCEAPNEFLVFGMKPEEEMNYRAACKLLALIKQRVEVWDATQSRFFLVDSQAVEVPINYTASSISKITQHIEEVQTFLNPKHLEADSRWSFFRKAGIRAVRDAEKEVRLSILFGQIGTIIERARQDFSLYLERYSFEDALKGFDEKRLKFIADLNQVLASVQSALLAVPVGFFLVAEKIKQAPGWTGQNLVIGAGGLIFCFILLILLRNQGRTLKAVQEAIQIFKEEQESKKTPKIVQILAMTSKAKEHSNRVWWFLQIVTFLVVAFALVIVGAVIWASTPQWQGIIPYSPLEKTSSTSSTPSHPTNPIVVLPTMTPDPIPTLVTSPTSSLTP